ncbi:minor tail protein [Microbacterium phage Barnstormer]|uniref:Minor tail protein n=1 Tax=Microbacterium phage Barnstormer TaxID=3028491 RepID=A0AAF0CJY0_9CAUD|nr:minor tail protein [Microbacterium phage Barnstormer]WDS52121.1 minor tail protein [Microbacterium phage UtzChips]
MHPTFAIVSPRGQRVELATSAGSESPFVLDEETTGLGFVDREVQVAPSTSDGGRFRASRAASRPFTLVVTVWGRTVEERTANVRKLATAVRRVNGLRLPRLEATLPDGTVYELPFVHDGGGDAIKRKLAGAAQTIPLMLIAPDPFWTARDATPYVIEGLNSTGTFLPGLAEMRLTGSASAGVLYVDNVGEADAFATWRLTGPTTLATVALGSERWSIGPLEVGEVVTIDTKARTVTLQDGSNAYDRMGTAPRLFAIPPGRNELSVVMTDATADTSATCYFRPRMEVIL